MTEKEKEERRTGTLDRRDKKMDRRQFIDIGWTIEKERRADTVDRRQGPIDRRGE